MFLLIDMEKAIALWGKFDANEQPPDFTIPSQPHSTNFKKHNSHCKQAHTIRLKEKSWSLISCLSLDLMIKTTSRKSSRCKDTYQVLFGM